MLYLETIQICKKCTRKTVFVGMLIAIVLTAVLTVVFAVVLRKQPKQTATQTSQTIYQGILDNTLVACMHFVVSFYSLLSLIQFMTKKVIDGPVIYFW